MAPRQRKIIEDEGSPSPPSTVSKKELKKCAPATTSASWSKAEAARERHDVFNLVVLIPLIYLTWINYDWNAMFVQGPEQAWTGDFFQSLWGATVAYFVVDLLWVWMVPVCVKSPDVIIKHHLVAIGQLCCPLYFPEYRWFMGPVMSVEINTWFLIARRVLYKRQMPTWVTDPINFSFYASWLFVRCFVYPALLWIFVKMADEGIRRTQSIMHIQLLFIPLHFIFVLLNLKWTYDLFTPIFKRWFGTAETKSGVASGL